MQASACFMKFFFGCDRVTSLTVYGDEQVVVLWSVLVLRHSNTVWRRDTPATDKHHDYTPIKTAAMLTLNTPIGVKCILTPSSNKHTLTVIEQSHSSVTICVFDILGEGNMSGSSNWVSLSLPIP